MKKTYTGNQTIQDLVAEGQASPFFTKLLPVWSMEEGQLLGYLEGADTLTVVTDDKAGYVTAFRVKGKDVETDEPFDITQPEGANVGGRRRRRSTRVTKRRKVLSRRRRLDRR